MTDREIFDTMRAALDKQLIAALQADEPPSAAILTAAIKRVEQLAKASTTDPNQDMADRLAELVQQGRVIPETDLEADDPATDERD